MPLYNDPKLIKMVRTRERRGLSCKAIAADLGVSHQTVRKILDPAYVEAERERLRAVDEARSPRSQGESYRTYQAEYGRRPERLEQVRLRMQRLREERGQ